jgi:hypothetical protein
VVSSISNQGGNPFGDSIIRGVDGFNKMLNTPAMSSVGKAFDATGILKPVHLLADLAGFGVMKMMEGVGRACGGKGDIDYHLKDEWGIGGSSCGKNRGGDDAVRGKEGWDGSMSACRNRAGAQWEHTSQRAGCNDWSAHRCAQRADFGLAGLNRYDQQITTVKTAISANIQF